MLKRLKALFSRSTILSGARRLGWVRLHELTAAQEKISTLMTHLAEGAAVRKQDQEQINSLSDELSAKNRLAEERRLALEKQVAETAAARALSDETRSNFSQRLKETTVKSAAFAQQLEIWRGRAAEYKQAVAMNAKRLAASRTHVQELTQQAEHLRAGQVDAELRARNLIGAMRARELEAAQNLSLMRASVGRTQQQADALGNAADRERLLVAEIDRLKSAGERAGQTLHLTYDVEPALAQLRAGRMAIVPFSLETLVGDFPLASALVLTSDMKVSAELRDIADRGGFSMRPLVLSAPEETECFDTVLTAFDLDVMDDPVAALAAAARCVNPGGALVLVGSALQSTISGAAGLWRAPPKMLQSLLPRWTWDRFVLAGPGGKIGLEIVDPALLLEIRPALGKGAALLAPPYMSCVAVARNQSRVER